MNEKWKHIEGKIKTISVGISLFITIGGVVIGLFNYATLNQLAPLSARIEQVEANDLIVKDQLASYKIEQMKTIDTLATKDQVSGIITRLDKISGRLDSLITRLIQ